MRTITRSKTNCLFAAAVSLFIWFAPAQAQDTVAEPREYRMENYRAPVPATLAGARVVSTAEVEKLWKDKSAIFLDVMPRLPKPDKLPAGTIWRDKKRFNIPGSIWLDNVGYGALSADMTQYYRDGLKMATGGDLKHKPLLFYCLTDCWMSWNAARRAIEWGFTNVMWYPAGADGWEKAGLPLVEAQPWRK